jgi:DNA repair protein RadC
MSEIVSDKVLLAPLYHLELVRDRDIPYDGNAKTTDAAAQVLHDLLDRSPTEQLAVMYLSSGLDILGVERIGMGSLEAVQAHPQEVFRGAIVKAAPEILVCHNHPSGEVRPSIADIKFTLSVITAGGLLGIRLRDHIIIGPNGKHMSLYDNQHLLSREFDQAKAEMLGLGGIDLEGLKKKLINLIDPNSLPATPGSKKGGDPQANSPSQWKQSLSYALLSR